MHAAVRDARDGVGRVIGHLLCHELGVEAFVGAEEFDLEIAGDREIEHHVDRMAIFLGADLAERFADELVQFRAVVDPLHDERVHRAADARLDRAQFAIRRVGLALDRFAERRVFHAGELLLAGAGRDRAPRGARVEEIPVLEQ